MSLDYNSGLTPTSLSPSASLGSLLDPLEIAHIVRPASKNDINPCSLWQTFHHNPTNNNNTANDHRILRTDDGSLFGMVLRDCQLSLKNDVAATSTATTAATTTAAATTVPMREVFIGILDPLLENSLSGLPGVLLSLDEFPSDPNMFFDLDEQFKQNSMKLDEYICRAGNLDWKDDKVNYVNTNDVDSVDYDYGYGEAMPSITKANETLEDRLVKSYPGKRRKAQRRGSMPTMHIGEYSSNYETHSVSPDLDPFEPTPIKEPPHHQDNKILQNELDSQQQQPLDKDDEDAYSIQPEKRRRAQRRGSMPTMHLHYSIQEKTSHSDINREHEESPFLSSSNIPEGHIRGRMPRRGSTGSFYSAFTSVGFGQPPCDIPVDHTTQDDGGLHFECQTSTPSSTPAFDPNTMMLRLQSTMQASQATQKALQTWDKKNGLPKSHSQTMVNSSRSRQQLQSGAILPKWDGTPLINDETELGKPKPRSHKFKKSSLQSNTHHGKMMRRMSAPSNSGFVF